MANGATAAYQRSLALSLYSISPSLSALHASRISLEDRSEQPLTPLSCPKCGNILLGGRGLLKTRRRMGRRKGEEGYPVKTRIKRSCAACGLSEVFRVGEEGSGKSEFEPARTIARRREAKAHELATRTPQTLTPLELSAVRQAKVVELARPAFVAAVATSSMATASTLSQSSTPSDSPQTITFPSISSRAPVPAAHLLVSNTAAALSARVKRKKKTSLHDMLERNRMQQQQQKNAQSTSGSGLFGFLEPSGT